MSKKRILLISYYWPPAGGGGVQRWLKMTKYLPDMGYDVMVYTPENGEFPAEDASLLKEVHPDITLIKTPIWEPYGWYKRFTGRKKSEKVYSGFISHKKEGWLQKIAVFIRGNFFIPDARKFWIKPSVKYLNSYLKSNPVDVIISTGPPHSMHLIALGVTKKHSIPWIADFRDPWTNIDFYDQLRLTKQADRKHRSLEMQVLRNATKVVTVSDSWAKDFVAICGRSDIEVIHNGYDEADFSALPEPSNEFSICHIGSMNKDRDPGLLWEALKELLNVGQIVDIKIRLIGQVDHQIFESLTKNLLMDKVEHIPFMPHQEVVNEIGRSTLLLLPINQTPNSAGVIPGKLFEYLGSGRPILGIGPLNGDSALILRKTSVGKMVERDDKENMKNEVIRCYNSIQGKSGKTENSAIRHFSRKALASKYSDLITQLLPQS